MDPLRGALAVAGGGSDVWPALLLTRDGGRTWAPAAPAWPAVSVPAGQGLLVSPTLLAHGERLVLALDTLVDRSSGPSQQRRRLLAASADGGATWGAWAETPPISSAAPMRFDDAGTLLLADGTRLWSSADGGRTWRSRTVAGPDGQQLVLLAAQGGMLLVARLGGPGDDTAPKLLRSRDGGGHWTEIALPAVPR